jgi:hypothetical protein
MGANNGTGHPNWLRCAMCRRSRNVITDRGWKLTATGRVRKRRTRGGARTTNREIEIACADCQHVGWTSHIDAERLLLRAQASGQIAPKLPDGHAQGPHPQDT